VLHQQQLAKSAERKGIAGRQHHRLLQRAVLPFGSEEEVVASSLYYSQRWGGTSLLLGKINMIDLLANDPFFGGWGIDRFMNLAFVAPPDGVVPPVIMGGILSQQIGEVSLSAMVFDPADQTNN
jgi:porin